MLMGGRAEGLACADPVARTSMDMSENLLSSALDYLFFYFLAKEGHSQVFINDYNYPPTVY